MKRGGFLKRTPFKRPDPFGLRKRRDTKGRFVVKPGARVKKNCVVCGAEFLSWANKRQRTCGLKCRNVNSKHPGTHEDRVCKECGMSFAFKLSTLRVDPRRGQYCSVPCRNAAKVKRHEASGVNPRYKNEAFLKGDKEWKKAVREKDNYTCQRCGVYQKYVHAHHVAPRSRRPDLIRDVSNGKCLCASCHAWVHMHPIEATKAGLLSDVSYELAQKNKVA